MMIRKDSSFNNTNNSNNKNNTSPTADMSSSSSSSSSSSALAWWLSSLLCGASTALVYSLWVDGRHRHRRRKSGTRRRRLLVLQRDDDDDDDYHRADRAAAAPSESNNNDSHDDYYYYHYCIQKVRNYMQTQKSRHVVVAQTIRRHLQDYQDLWKDIITHVCLGSFLWGMLESCSCSSSSTRWNGQTAAAAAPLLVTVLGGGGGLVGFLWIRTQRCCCSLSPADTDHETNSCNYHPLDQSLQITPYLFLYAACPPTQRVRLWFAWMALRWVDLIATTKRTTTTTIKPPGNGTNRVASKTTFVPKIHHTSDTNRGTTEPQQTTSRSAIGGGGGGPGAETAVPPCDTASVGSSHTNNNNNTPPLPGRYLELLVHNVSHTDFVLSLDIPNNNNNNSHDDDDDDTDDVDKYCLCRPRFSFFDTYCRMALESLSCENNVDNDAKIVNFSRYKRALDDPRRYIIQEASPATGSSSSTLIPTGFELKPDPHHLVAKLSEVRVRGIDQAKVADALLEDTDIENEEEEDGTVLLAAGVEHQSPTSSSWATSKTNRSFPIGHVFFPLLATLLPRWQCQIAEKEIFPGRAIVKRVLVLVTGVGTPRNFTHSLRGNSTQACAVLMERFLRRIDPGLTVVRIHSETNIFRYDDNLLFVERDLMPVLNSYRDTHAMGLPYPDEVKTAEEKDISTTTTTRTTSMPLQPFNADWRKSLSVSVSFADGSPARTYAIQASMRPFRPTFFHFWQLKTFWHESKIVDDDLEVHSFEAMETSPPVDTDRLRGDPQLQAVVAEMKSFREDMVKALQSGQHDIETFWLRKTFKPVLAVLLVHSADMKDPILYRGTNMEVSMPTGSLCAERNVIGTALSANPRLKREDLKMIAVLAVPYTPTIPDSITGGGAGMKRINSTASFTSAGRKISIGSEQEEWVASSSSLTTLVPTAPLLSSQRHSREDLASSFAMVGLNDVIFDSSGEHVQSTGSAAVEASNVQQQPDIILSSAPVRKIALFSKSTSLPDSMSARSDSNSHNDNIKGSKKKPTSSSQQHQQHDRHDEQQQHVIHRHQYRQQYDKRTVIVHNPSTDMNPLAPCGACNEWLKKIAEPNPYFRIVTFTDADCNGVYCTNCQE